MMEVVALLLVLIAAFVFGYHTGYRSRLHKEHLDMRMDFEG